MGFVSSKAAAIEFCKETWGIIVFVRVFYGGILFVSQLESNKTKVFKDRMINCHQECVSSNVYHSMISLYVTQLCSESELKVRIIKAPILTLKVHKIHMVLK